MQTFNLNTIYCLFREKRRTKKKRVEGVVGQKQHCVSQEQSECVCMDNLQPLY